MRLALTLFLVSPAVFAVDPARMISQYGHSVWTVQEGLLPGAPMGMTQTTDGFIWIGTRGGLVRFDGARFTPFAAPPGQKLSSNRILSVGAGSDGSLWIGTRVGLHRYKDGRLTDFPDAPGWIMSIVERDGRIWFTRSSVRDDKGPLCEVQGDKAVCHADANGVPIKNGRQLAKDAEGNLWTVSDDTLMRWKDGVSRTWHPPGIPETDKGPVLDALQSVAVAPDGSIWVGATQPSRGLGLLKLVDGKLQAYVVPGLDGSKLAMSLPYVDRHNALWVGTQDEGLYRLHEGRVERFRARDGLSGDTIQGMFEDREGNFWVMTTRGIESFRDLRVTSVTSREGLSADLANAVLARRDGSVWINTWHSIDVLRNGKITSINTRNGLPGDEVMGMFEDRAGLLWVGIDLDLYVLEDGKFNIIRRPDGGHLGVFRGAVEDAAGDLWILTTRPFSLMRLRDRKLVEEITRPFILTDRTLALDARSGVWLGLNNGDLGHYHDGKLDRIPFNRDRYTGAVTGLVTFPHGGVLGSSAFGLVAWRDGTARTMNAATNGLPCDDIHTLLVDGSGALWLYANCGVIEIPAEQVELWWRDPSARVRFRLLDALDGAQPAYGAFFPRGSVGLDGRLWFANASVVQLIDPQRLAGNPLAPPVKIERLVADRTDYPLQEGVQLPPNVGDLQIDYTGLSFTAPRKMRFRYRLAGHDADWQDVGTRRQAFYTDLPPRDYVFEVTASNNDGVWNQAGSRIAFSIAPTFYQTRIFAVLCVLAAVGAMWFIYLMRIRQVEARARIRAEERIEERERIARELHDTLLQGLLSASLQLSVANQQIPPEAPAKSLVEKILKLLRQVSEEGRNAVRGLRTRAQPADALERALSEIPADLAMDAQTQFRLRSEGTQRALRPAVRDEIYRITREALANAFRHSGASNVETVLEYSPDALRVTIRDDGRGMDPDVLQSGREGHWGLSGMRERSSRIGARLKVLSAPGSGTEIDLVVPGGAAFEAGTRRRWFGWT